MTRSSIRVRTGVIWILATHARVWEGLYAVRGTRS